MAMVALWAFAVSLEGQAFTPLGRGARLLLAGTAATAFIPDSPAGVVGAAVAAAYLARDAWRARVRGAPATH